MNEGTVMITSAEYRKLVESKTKAECKIQQLIKEKNELIADYEGRLFNEWCKGRNSADSEVERLKRQIVELKRELEEAKEPCIDCASRRVEEDD